MVLKDFIPIHSYKSVSLIETLMDFVEFKQTVTAVTLNDMYNVYTVFVWKRAYSDFSYEKVRYMDTS